LLKFSELRKSAVKSLDSMVARTRAILKDHPLPMLFPPEPWDEYDLDVIAEIIESHIATSNEVVTDFDPYSTWLDRYRFHQSVRQTVGE
jgi:hypothetical protein